MDNLIDKYILALESGDPDKQLSDSDDDVKILKDIQKALINITKERNKYVETFMHTHVAGDKNIDICAKCGLDIRDKIHFIGQDKVDLSGVISAGAPRK